MNLPAEEKNWGGEVGRTTPGVWGCVREGVCIWGKAGGVHTGGLLPPCEDTAVGG